MAKTLDEKLLFAAYDCAPGNVAWRAFSRNLLAHGGKDADDEGSGVGGGNVSRLSAVCRAA